MERKRIPDFTSDMSRRERLLALLYLPVHMVLLPIPAVVLLERGILSEAMANFSIYAVGAVYMLLALGRFLRRDFDPLWERPFYVLSEICGHYLLMLVANMAVNSLLLLMPEENPNNSEIFAMAGEDFGVMAAMAVCLAPIVEELIFRGGIFGLARKRSRRLAYVLSALLFSFYHVWAYALEDVRNLLYLLQYLPVSLLLCRCYERTNSIWGCIFFHMLVNGASFYTMEALLVWIR